MSIYPGLIEVGSLFIQRIKNTHPSSEFIFQDDGGEEVVKSLCADAMETLQLMWRSVAAPLTVPDAKKEQDKLKVPSIGGIWKYPLFAYHTVDGRDPAPVDRSLSHYFQGFIHPQVVQDFFHQQSDPWDWYTYPPKVQHLNMALWNRRFVFSNHHL